MGSKASSLSSPPGESILTGAQVVPSGALSAQHTVSEGVRNVKDCLPLVGKYLFSKGKVAKSRTIEYYVLLQCWDNWAR